MWQRLNSFQQKKLNFCCFCKDNCLYCLSALEPDHNENDEDNDNDDDDADDDDLEDTDAKEDDLEEVEEEEDENDVMINCRNVQLW